MNRQPRLDCTFSTKIRDDLADAKLLEVVYSIGLQQD
jgi:hypothetical protein